MEDISNSGGILKKTKILTVNNKIGYAENAEGIPIVFANTDIKAGDIIETVPYIEVFDEAMNIKEISDHVFTINSEERKFALGLGFACLYQHNDKPNAQFNVNEEKKQIRFTAKEEIKKSQEITISYGKEYFLSREKQK